MSEGGTLARSAKRPGETPTRARKNDHLELCARGNVSCSRKTTLLEDVELVHEALPEFSAAGLDLSASLFGRTLRAPLLVTALSGGVPEAERLNGDLAEVARELGVGLGLGSQRVQAEGDASWPRLREGPGDGLLLLGNIGIAQARVLETARLADLAAAVGADALCVHLNAAQEWFQGEGDRDFRGSLDALERLARELPVPLMVKETGCGISALTARRLRQAGVKHLDVAGAGGTTWIGVELLRKGTPAAWEPEFREWGIPTAASVSAAAEAGFETLVASGGIRSGLEAAKAVALGAHAAGFALPVLRAWKEGGRKAVRAFLADAVEGFRTAMALCGARTPAELRGRFVVTGPALRAWTEGMARAVGRAR
jgi:isopentenyl-diphosphate delta-isomerase